MHVVVARYCYRMSSVCPSVCPSVTLMYCEHIGWTSSKLIAVYSEKIARSMPRIVTESIVYVRSNFRGGLRNTHVFWNTVRNDPSRSSKVVDFGTNRKRVCDLLLVVNSNLGPKEWLHPYFTRILGVYRVPLGQDCRYCGSEEQDPKLIIHVINFELVQPICSRYINVTERQTDGQTDDIR